MRRAITALTKMVFITNPNNPTGTILTAEEVDKFLDKVPKHVIVVFDEAYYDFAKTDFRRPGPVYRAPAEAHRHPPHVLEDGRSRGAPDRLCDRRSGLRRADEPHPPAVQREHARSGRGAGGPCRTRRTCGVPSRPSATASGSCRRRWPRWVSPACRRGLRHGGTFRCGGCFQKLLQLGVIVPTLGELRPGLGTPDYRRHARGEHAGSVESLRTVLAQKGARGSARPRWSRLTVVGPGLIGGSIARGVRTRGLAREVVVVTRHAAAIRAAVDVGAADSGTTDLAAGVVGAALVVLCAPVGALPGLIRATWPHLAPGAVLTDAGSVKRSVVEAALECPASPASASSVDIPWRAPSLGMEHQEPDLFEGRLALATPRLPGAPPAAVAMVAAFGRVSAAASGISRSRPTIASWRRSATCRTSWLTPWWGRSTGRPCPWRGAASPTPNADRGVRGGPVGQHLSPAEPGPLLPRARALRGGPPPLARSS